MFGNGGFFVCLSSVRKLPRICTIKVQMTGVLPNPFEVIYEPIEGPEGKLGLNRAFDLLFEEIFKEKQEPMRFLEIESLVKQTDEYGF